MAILPKLKELLDARQVRHEVRAHKVAYTATGVAAADHVPPSEMAKVVVLRGCGGYLMAVLPASRELDVERLRDAVGDPDARLASEDEFAHLFPGCEPGAMPPFGDLFGMPLWADDSLGRESETVFNAGNHRETVHMAYCDFVRLAHPTFAAFARQHAGAAYRPAAAT
ncbi:MAG TPA: YbaK/EbsC family protein [Candidatus Binatia bacterium]|nr:YbaK/EbsC family protein [Candidatus Binatia bacterium]